MSYVSHLDGKDYFHQGHIPIRVLTAEHNTSGDIYHSHSFYEFVYIDRGFSTHFYNNTTALLTPGDIFGMRPGDVHGYVYPKNTILYNCLFNPEALENELDEIRKLPGMAHIFDPDHPSVWQRIRLGPAHRKYAVSCLEQMRLECEYRSTGWELKLKGLLLEFLVLFSRSYLEQFTREEEGGYKYTQYVYEALEYIEQNYTRGILVEEIANHVGLSTDYFSRMFKQFTGLTPVEYIKNVRLAKAAELLRSPELSVAQVAMEVGFEDPSYFSRQFKQVLGMSPSSFQKENRHYYNQDGIYSADLNV